MSVSGDELVLTVAHRGRDLAYPLLVDPEIVVNLSEIPFVWEFYFVDNVPYYCGGEGYSNSYSGCHEEDPYFSHSEPGSGEPFAITLLPTTIPIYRTRFNEHTEKEEKVEIHSANAEWWWKPSGNEGITAVEFEGITSSGSTEGTGYVRFEISACRQSQDWTSTEVGPTSYRFTPKEPFNCNKYNDYNEAVRFELYGGTTSLKEPSEEAGFEGKLSVNAILITRPISEEEKEEERTEKYGEKNPSKPNEKRCMTEDPVNCATGNMVVTQTDLSIGGREPGLSLTRTYNSQLAYYQTQREESPGMFGLGWTNSYSTNAKIGVRCGDGFACNEYVAIINQNNGSTVSFRSFLPKGRSPTQWTPVDGSSVQSRFENTSSGYDLTLPDQTKLSFNASGQLASETNRNGNVLALAYDGSNQLKTVTDAAGRKLTFAYNSGGLVESVKDPLGHTVKYMYESHDLKSVTQPGESARRWEFKYNGENELSGVTDGRGHTTTTEYEPFFHRVKFQKDPLGRQRKWSYATTASGSETTLIEPNGSTTVEKFNTHGLPTSVTRAAGTPIAATTTHEYNEAGELIATTDPDGHRTEYGYDAAGNRTSETNADGDQTKWTYDSAHDVIATTNPDGETTTIARNSHGDPETISRSGPNNTTQTTRYTYDPEGDLETVTDPLERTWTYEYDTYGDRNGETDPTADKRTWGYNEDSQETSEVSPRGNAKGAEASQFTTKTERDAQGRPVTVADPLGHVTKYAYDGDGNIESVADPNGHKTKYTYDADNEQTKVESAGGIASETGYDNEGQITSQTDGNKHTTKYVRNALEEVTETIDPIGRKTTKEYDAAGNLIHVTNPAKQTTTYSYDLANRLKEVSYSDGKTPTVTYEYDNAGNPLTMKDGTGTTSYEYDQLGRLTHTTNGNGENIGYGYDLANEQTKLTYPNGQTVTRGYSQDGRLQTVTDWLGNQTKFNYDPDANLTSITFPATTGDQDKYAYDNVDRMSEAQLTKSTETLASLAYTRDNDGQVTATVAKGLPGEEKTVYTYDSNNRLIKAGAAVYGYDAANNPLKLGSSTYTYDNADQLKTGTGVKYGYNEEGERVKSTPSGAATTYGYDQAGNLTAVERPAEGKNPQIKDTYAYDGNGLRASQTISGTTTYMAWNTAEGTPQLLSDGTNSYIYGPGSTPIEQINNSTGAVEYLHHDQAGSTRLLTGSTGKTEATFTYGPYGELTGSTGTATTPLGYDAQYTSSDTGLIYLRAREYDPKTAQFLSRDPLAAISGEPYSYAGDNPLTYGDPTGLLFGIELPSLEEIGEGIAGWGDTITFGGTKWVREQIGDENVDTCSGAYQGGGIAGLVTGALIPGEDDAEAGEAAEWTWKTRAEEGADGGISEYGKERLEGETISTAHKVELEDELIHQHQTHIGKYGGERQFPNEWIQYPDVGAP